MAPCRSNGERPAKYLSGTGVLLQAFISGDQGDRTPNNVNAESDTRISNNSNTDTGRRRQLFSPVPDSNGRAIKNPIPTTGPTNSRKVSISGGRSANAAKIHRKKKSGRGTVSTTVGSGAPLGPNGPKTAAHTTTAKITIPENTKSLRNASGIKGTPSLWVI